MIFYKMQALGNDFIVVKDYNEKNIDFTTVSKKLCERKTGIGADGLILVNQLKSGKVVMKVYNQDGTFAETCGNGLRCVALLYFLLHGRKNLLIQTKNRISTASVKNESEITVKIGKLEKEVNSVGLNLKEPFFAEKVNINGKNAKAFFVSVGNPHAVFLGEKNFLNELDNIVKFVNKNNFFKNGANIEVCEIIDSKTVNLRIYERGANETNACGTGASATVGVLVEHGLLKENENITVNMKGGSVTIKVTNGNIYLTGSAELVYKGEINV